MDKIEKSLNKLGPEERRSIKAILVQINNGNFDYLDLKKLKGRNDIFRVRKGNIRIIFHKTDDFVKILTLERRSEKTYRKR